MKTTQEPSPTTGSEIVRVRPGPARVAFAYQRQRSLSMSTEIERGPVFSIANMQQLDGPSSATFIVAVPSPISPKNRVAKLRQLFDQSSTPEVDRLMKEDCNSSVVQANTITRTSPDTVVSTLQIKQTITVRTGNAISGKPVAPSSPSIDSDLSSRPVLDSHRPPTAYRIHLEQIRSQLKSTTDTDTPLKLQSNMPKPSPATELSVNPLNHYSAPLGGFVLHRPIDSITEPKTEPQSPTASSANQDEDVKAKKEKKLRQRIEEARATEQSYAKILYVLAKKLPRQVEKTCVKDENLLKTFNQLFQPLLDALNAIYKLHHRNILPQMDRSLTGHRQGLFWSILEENFESIERLYKAYYIAFDDVQNKLEEFCRTHALIQEAMLKVQEDLAHLYPITQLNCANQRLLRYIILMEAYMKNLEPTSADFEHAAFVHDEVQRIAIRCDEQLVTSPTQLNKLKLRLDSKGEYLKNQKLLWHGSLKKQSPRKYTDIARRYVIILSDTILVCRESGPKLETKRELSVRDVTIDASESRRAPLPNANSPPESLSVGQYYPFRVSAVEKSYEFVVDKEQERDVWMKKLNEAREDCLKRSDPIEIRKTDGKRLGIRAPSWIHDTDVTRCQNCNNHFPSGIIVSRRHHCRSCGRCVCGACSSKKLLLNYCKNEGEVRVCDQCYAYLTGADISRPAVPPALNTRDPDRTILADDFRSASTNTTVWIALQEDHRLHVYGARLDEVEDYSIKLVDLQELVLANETRTFTLQENNRTHKFSIDLAHRFEYTKNDYVADQLKLSSNKLSSYARLWFEGMQLGRKSAVPAWYINKRESADSGVAECWSPE